MGGTELAKAYVQVIPSAQGIKGSLSNVLGGEATSAGGIAGAGIAGAIKKAIVAAGIGMALKKVFSDSFANGAELEQNLGGTKAVFGDFADEIQASAKKAYSNMGMSASDYMATANKMGSLFQGSGIEQQESLEMTSSAMQRAADVASVMGVDTSMAMESIAGAAKGNFTMMDNLGVAMNATTLQAYALEKGVNFDWNTATQAQKSELAMQMFMDRTSQYAGNYAVEAKNTWTGSIEAVKAAYENLTGNLMLGNDLGPSLQALGTTVTTFLTGQFVPAVVNIATALPGALVSMITQLAPALITAGMQLVTGLGTSIVTAAPQLYTSAMELVRQLQVGIQTQLPLLLNEGFNAIYQFAMGILMNLPTVILSIGNIISGLLGALMGAMPMILEKGGTLIVNLVHGIIQNLPQVILSVAQIISKFLTTIAQNLPQILQSGVELIGKLVAGIIRAIPQVIAAIPQIISGIRNKFSETDWGSIGRNIITGLKNGIVAAGHMIWDAVKDILGNFKDKVLDFFGIHSPSRWGIWVGNMIDQGLANGISGNMSVINRSVNGLLDSMSNTFEQDMGYSLNATYSSVSGSRLGAQEQLLNSIDTLARSIYKAQQNGTQIVMNGRVVGRTFREMGVAFN